MKIPVLHKKLWLSCNVFCIGKTIFIIKNYTYEILCASLSAHCSPSQGKRRNNFCSKIIVSKNLNWCYNSNYYSGLVNPVQLNICFYFQLFTQNGVYNKLFHVILRSQTRSIGSVLVPTSRIRFGNRKVRMLLNC